MADSTVELLFNVSQDGWAGKAFDAIRDNKLFRVTVSSEVMAEVIHRIHTQADNNPFNSLIKSLPLGVPANFLEVAAKLSPWMSAVAAMGGGPAGVAAVVGIVFGFAAFHGYDISIGWEFHKLMDLNDDEAFILFKPKLTV